MKKTLLLVVTVIIVLCLLTACGEVKRSEAMLIPDRSSFAQPVAQDYFVKDMEIGSLKSYACKAVGVGGTVTEINCSQSLAGDVVFIVDGFSADGKEIECILHGVTGTGISFIAGERPYLSCKSDEVHPAVDFSLNVYVNNGNGYANAANGRSVSDSVVKERMENDAKTYEEILNANRTRIDENTYEAAFALKDLVVTEADLVDTVPEDMLITVPLRDVVHTAVARSGLTYRRYTDGWKEVSPCTISHIMKIKSFAGNEYYDIVVKREKPIKTEFEAFEIIINGTTGQTFCWGQGILNSSDWYLSVVKNNTSGVYVVNSFLLRDGVYEDVGLSTMENMTEDSPVFIESRELENTLYAYSVAHCRYRIDKSTIESDLKELMGWKTDSPDEAIPDLNP